mmetsp:Transcript_58093/g.106879  ORF Transcript_58093/g.106879 Transcript_58093/m.106879 type:complete len:429 (+) Transcript_58093:159-1445(+)
MLLLKALYVALLAANAILANGLPADLAGVEVLLDRCRASVSNQRMALLTCGASSLRNPQGGTCNCFCPTCPPQEWPHRQEPPPCTTMAPLTTMPQTTMGPPPTAPPASPLAPLKVPPPLDSAHLPTLEGPDGDKLLNTVIPTTTGLPTIPPGECSDDGIYRGSGEYDYTLVGEGLCVDKEDAEIPFKKQRELTMRNLECICKEACDSAPACLGYSINRKDIGFGHSCRVYGTSFPSLVDRWLDLGSLDDPTYSGRKIVKADGTKSQKCYKRTLAAKAKLAAKAQSSRSTVSLLQGAIRPISTTDHLAWQFQQLARCREAEAEHMNLLQQRGCRARGLQRRGQKRQLAIPNECNCQCPACNWMQMPPPFCTPVGETTPAPAEETGLKPPGLAATPPPGPATPAPQMVEVPQPFLPPIGAQYLPTLAPLD